jgi:hypothetical protein
VASSPLNAAFKIQKFRWVYPQIPFVPIYADIKAENQIRNGASGMSNIEGKGARVAPRELGRAIEFQPQNAGEIICVNLRIEQRGSREMAGKAATVADEICWSRRVTNLWMKDKSRKAAKSQQQVEKEFFENARPKFLLKLFATPNESVALSKEKNFMSEFGSLVSPFW